MSTPLQYNIFGHVSPTASGEKIISNLEKMARSNSRLFFLDNDDVIWIYYQTYCGVGDAISRDQYFTLPMADSIRRKWDDYKKKVRQEQTLNSP